MKKKIFIITIHLIISNITTIAIAGQSDDLAAWTPIQIGISSDMQIANMNSDLYGLGLGFYCKNKNTAGINLNVLGSGTNENFYGIQLSGLSNRNKGKSYGLQIAGLENVNADISYGAQVGFYNESKKNIGLQFGIGNSGDFIGIQAAFLSNCSLDLIHFDNFRVDMAPDRKIIGAQLAFVSNNAATCYGIQISGTNINDYLIGGQIGFGNESGTATGFQIGAMNFVKDIKGVQIGLINVADNCYGVQIGIINIMKEAKRYYPIINAKF